MSDKTFINIPKEECLEVSIKVLANSDSKWLAGEKLADIGEFGGATSFAIISVEELIKSLILHLDSQGFQFRRIKGMDVLFNHHQVRYLVAYAIFLMGIFKNELMKFIVRIHSDPNYLSMIVAMKENEDEMLSKTKFWALRKFALISREFEWFSKLDIFRQDGFYSDYEDQLKNPLMISETNYRIVTDRLSAVRLIGKELIDTVNSNDPDYKEQFDTIKRDMIRRGLYKRMENSLAILRQNRRQSPFELIRRFLL